MVSHILSQISGFNFFPVIWCSSPNISPCSILWFFSSQMNEKPSISPFLIWPQYQLYNSPRLKSQTHSPAMRTQKKGTKGTTPTPNSTPGAVSARTCSRGCSMLILTLLFPDYCPPTMGREESIIRHDVCRFDADDDAADRMYAAVDQHLDMRRKRQRLVCSICEWIH